MPVEFVASASGPEQFPRDGRAEVAFVGRSNVGKSSLLNALILKGRKRQGGAPDRRQLAFVSSTPGRTQTINFYLVNGEFYFVDLPGYGFAKAPRSEIARWRERAESYLTERPPLRLVVLIVDSRHGPTDLDRQMKEWLFDRKQRFLVAASKVDKLNRAQRTAALRSIEEEFFPPVPFSAVTGEGVGPLWDGIRVALEA